MYNNLIKSILEANKEIIEQAKSELKSETDTKKKKVLSSRVCNTQKKNNILQLLLDIQSKDYKESSKDSDIIKSFGYNAEHAVKVTYKSFTAEELMKLPNAIDLITNERVKKDKNIFKVPADLVE